VGTGRRVIAHPDAPGRHDAECGEGVDLRDSDDAAIAVELASTADIVFEIFCSGVVNRLGWDINSSQLSIRESSTAPSPFFGDSESARDLAGYELLVQRSEDL
jgi:crotonobetainyl-CoA:carnitine CoA-transferase CaiB-like acyl-CoA transferase